MEDHRSIRQDPADEGADPSSISPVSGGVRQTQIPRGDNCGVSGQSCPDPWPERGGLLTEEELNASGHRSISASYLTELHQISIHKFNHADSDFSLGFWNGYGCAIKAVIEKAKDFT